MEANGDCFEVAGTMILDNPMVHALTLVHGIVTGQGPIEGVEHVHAWVEDSDAMVALDFSNGNAVVVPIDQYYKIGKIKKTARYDRKEVVSILVDTGVWGPWEDWLKNVGP